MYTQVFMGFKIPELCHDNEAFKAIAELFNSSKGTCAWCEGAYGIPNRGCHGVLCTKCILCDNAGRIPAEWKRKAFANYLRTRGIPVTRPGYETPKEKESMPELKPGMLIQLDTGVFTVYINSNYGYQVLLRDNRVVLGSLWRITNEHISKIWYSKLEPCVALSVGDIQYILSGNLKPYGVTRYWEKPESKATKMTLEEISQALGYEVEIVDEKTPVDLGVKGFADRV